MAKSDRKTINRILSRLGLVALVSLAMGAIVQSILAVGAFAPGFWSASLLIFLIGVVLMLAWQAAGAGKALAWMMIVAFILRLAVGVFLAWGLPQFGYDEPPQRAGFVFEDAYRREENAWNLAKSGDPLAKAFSNAYETDQYGGMLFLSALLYRTLSPDAYRPVLISILSAGAMTLSIPFLVAAMRRKFDRKTTLWAGWILALYPEGILLGAAQMREPIFILILTILFWLGGKILQRRQLKIFISAFVLVVIILFIFSYRTAFPILGLILLWMWVEVSSEIKKTWIKIAGWGMIVLGLVLVLWVFWYWVDAVLHWDTLTTIRQSQRILLHIQALPEWLHRPFIIVYGLFQPVLPAAIAAPAPWIWRSLGVFRALGWYLLLPLLAYALLRVWRSEKADHKRWLTVFIVLAWIWVLVASARAGGDQWDNPRYRTIFLPWMSIAGAWAVTYARHTRDRWLGRVILVEAIFLAFFTYWYFSRYTGNMPRLEFYGLIGAISALSLLVIVGGWLRDRHRARSKDQAELD